MKDLFAKAVVKAQTLDEVEQAILSVIANQNPAKKGKVGYVSGVITSDGPKYVQRNLQNLVKNTKKIRKAHLFPIFAPTDIFTDELFKRIDAFNLPEQLFWSFWRNVLGSGYITDIFMTPRWEISRGATDEHKTAKKLGLKIHYMEE